MSFLQIIAALQELEVLLKNYGPLAAAALAAYKAGGFAGLITYLEGLILNPQPSQPPVAEIQRVVTSLKAAHA